MLVKPGVKLHPELKKCLIPGPLGLMIGHKLVHDVLYHEDLHHNFNERLKFKKKAIKLALKSKDYSTFIFLHERPYRMDALLEIEKLCNEDKVFWRLAREVWEDSENIWQYIDEWEKLFRSGRPDSSYFMLDEELKRFCELPQTFTVYRGYRHSVNEYGLSWTLSKEKAEWFSKRFPSRHPTEEARVKSRLVQKADCFAYINNRQEEEIVIFPEVI